MKKTAYRLSNQVCLPSYYIAECHDCCCFTASVIGRVFVGFYRDTFLPPFLSLSLSLTMKDETSDLCSPKGVFDDTIF